MTTLPAYSLPISLSSARSATSRRPAPQDRGRRPRLLARSSARGSDERVLAVDIACKQIRSDPPAEAIFQRSVCRAARVTSRARKLGGQYDVPYLAGSNDAIAILQKGRSGARSVSGSQRRPRKRRAHRRRSPTRSNGRERRGSVSSAPRSRRRCTECSRNGLLPTTRPPVRKYCQTLQLPQHLTAEMPT